MRKRKPREPKFWDNTKHSFPAQLDGWDLFEVCGGEQDGELQIQVLQCPADNPELNYEEKKFKDDEAASAHVERMAFSGSELHQRAILELNHHKQPDIKRFSLMKRKKQWKQSL